MQIRNFCLGFAVFFLLGIGIVSAQEPETLGGGGGSKRWEQGWVMWSKG